MILPFLSSRDRLASRSLARSPLEYAPRSTTTLNHERLNDEDPNFFKLRLNFRHTWFRYEERTFLDTVLVRAVLVPGFVLFLAPLIWDAFGFETFALAFVVAPVLLATLATAVTTKSMAEVGWTLLFCLFVVAYSAVARQPLDPMSLGAGSITMLAFIGLTWFCFWACGLALSGLRAIPVTNYDWVPVVAQGSKRLAQFIETRLEILAILVILGGFAYCIVGVGTAGDLGIELARTGTLGGKSLALLTLWLIPSCAATIALFRRPALDVLVEDARAIGAPGMWTGSAYSATKRRMLAFAAVLAIHVALGLFVAENRRAFSWAPDDARAPRIGTTQDVAQLGPLLRQAGVLAVFSSAGILAMLAPFLIAYRVYIKLEKADALKRPIFDPPAGEYLERLQASDITLTGVDDEQIRECDHIYIGYEPFQRFPVLLHRPLLREHCYVVGDSGSGKTSLGLMPLVRNLIGFRYRTDEHPAVIILDLKGDMALFSCAKDTTGIAKRQFRYFTPEPNRSSHFFNPFNDIGDDSERTPIQLAELLLDALALNHGEGYGRSYYSRRNRDILLDALAQKPKARTFDDLHRALERLTQANPNRYRDSFELLATIRAMTFYPQLNKPPDAIDPTRAIHMPTVLAEGQTAYFWLPSATESVSVREIGKLALYALISAAIARPPADRREVYLVIDEFQRLAGENFKVILEQARSFGVGVIMANQSAAELKTPAGDLRSVVRSNTRVKMHFSVQGGTELSELSELSGEDVVRNESVALSTPTTSFSKREATQTVTTSFGVKPRLTPSDILAISDHPRRFVLHVTRGSGLTQFGGRAIPVEGQHIIWRHQYDKWSRAKWPQDATLPTTGASPVAIDAQSRLDVAAANRVTVSETFKSLADEDGADSPDE